MSILKVARMGHPVLRAKARPLEQAEISERRAIQKLIDDMIDTMAEYHGVGLAAPQVHEGCRLFVAALDAASDDDEEDASRSRSSTRRSRRSATDVVEDWEGCLSIPDIRGRVPRAREIKVRALDRSGDRIELRAHDFPARVIQHETDHLDGVLFFDRMKSFETLTFLDEYRALLAQDGQNDAISASSQVCARTLLLQRPLRLQPLQLHLGVIGELHGVGDGAVCPRTLGDRAVHLLADAAVRRDGPAARCAAR